MDGTTNTVVPAAHVAPVGSIWVWDVNDFFPSNFSSWWYHFLFFIVSSKRKHVHHCMNERERERTSSIPQRDWEEEMLNGFSLSFSSFPFPSSFSWFLLTENDKTPSIVDEVTFDPVFDTMDAIGNPLSDFPISGNHHMNDHHAIRQPFKRPPNHPLQSYPPSNPFNQQQQQPMVYPTRRRITNRFPHQHPLGPSNREFGSHGGTLLLPLDQSIIPRPSLIWTPIGSDPSFAIPLFAAANSSRIVRIKKQKLQSTKSTTITMPNTDEDD